MDWVGGGILLVGLGVVAWLMVARLFSPSFGVQSSEGDFLVVSVEDLTQADRASPNVSEEAVAKAVIQIKGRDVQLPLTPEQLDAIREGASIHATYTIYPFSRGNQIDIGEWRVLGLDEAGKGPVQPEPEAGPSEAADEP